MGNTSGNASGLEEQIVMPSEPGAQIVETNNSSSSSEGEKEVAIVAPKKGEGAGDFELFLSATPQNEQYTFAENVEKFYSKVTIEAPLFEEETRPSIDVVAVLDVSGSMSGEKISLVRKSMRRLVRCLGARDRVAFVTFDSRVEVVMNFCTLDENNKRNAFDVISKLKAGTSTNLSGGVSEGIQQLINNRVNDVAAVLLFTDGQANVGIRNTQGIVNEVLQITNSDIHNANVETWGVEQVCTWLDRNRLGLYRQNFQEQQVDGNMLKLDLNEEILKTQLGVSELHAPKFMREIEKLRGQVEGEGTETSTKATSGFRLHTFGFGTNHNVDLLQQLAENFDGMYFFMENEEAIKSGFANCLGGLLTTVALDLEVELEFNPEVSNGKIHKQGAVQKNGKWVINFADLQSEEKRDILVSCTMPAKEEAVPDYLLYEASLKYQNAVRNCESRSVVACEVNRNGKADDFNELVDECRNRELAAEALLEATRLGEKKDLKSARNRLQVTIDEIDRSRTSANTTSRNLRDDLIRARDKCRDSRTYKTEGDYYMRQNRTCYTQQRCCNYSNEYSTQLAFISKAKRSMNTRFEASDEEDSCDDEEF